MIDLRAPFCNRIHALFREPIPLYFCMTSVFVWTFLDIEHMGEIGEQIEYFLVDHRKQHCEAGKKRGSQTLIQLAVFSISSLWTVEAPLIRSHQAVIRMNPVSSEEPDAAHSLTLLPLVELVLGVVIHLLLWARVGLDRHKASKKVPGQKWFCAYGDLRSRF